MLFSNRARAQRPRPFARLAVSSFVIAVLLTPRAPAFASSHEDDQQRLGLPGAPVEAFAGEITYEFDSISNTTTATYVAPLGHRGLMHGILFAAPTVHTITVTYQFAGRIASHVPDTLRLVLESDDYVDPGSANPFVFGTEPIISIGIGGRSFQHSISVSQRIQLETGPPAQPDRMLLPDGRPEHTQRPQVERAHVRQRATSWFSSCEFLSMIDEREIRGTVAGVDFSLNHDVVTGLKLLAAEMLPETAQQRSIDCR